MINRLAILERGLLGTGLLLLTVSGGGFLDRVVYSSVALRQFDDTVERAEDPATSISSGAPVAVVSIEKVGIRAPVFEGTDEVTLNRGAGWILGTARPGEMGNIGIAGHRDGVFRRLKDLSLGDAIELSTTRATTMYTVDKIEIVAPTNVGVLRPRAVPTLTLVTCYPFNFVGHAPKRYILHASLTERTDYQEKKGEKKK